MSFWKVIHLSISSRQVPSGQSWAKAVGKQLKKKKVRERREVRIVVLGRGILYQEESDGTEGEEGG